MTRIGDQIRLRPDTIGLWFPNVELFTATFWANASCCLQSMAAQQLRIWPLLQLLVLALPPALTRVTAVPDFRIPAHYGEFVTLALRNNMSADPVGSVNAASPKLSVAILVAEVQLERSLDVAMLNVEFWRVFKNTSIVGGFTSGGVMMLG